jgi:glycosyltransferase involved in cell wall biosynthesis
MILMVGVFPPPLGGMASVQQALYEMFTAEGLSVEKLSTSPVSLKQDIFSRLSRWSGVVHAWIRLLSARAGEDMLYMAPSGRWGQVYDLVSLCIARFMKLRCVLHHHNYDYLVAPSRLTAILMRIAGPGALHVALCDDMACRLRSLYGVQQTLVLSNVLFAKGEPLQRVEPRVRAMGFLSNLIREKGTDAVIELAAEIKKAELPLKVIVAGPCLDRDLTKMLEASVESGCLEWRGAVYGEEKKRFWQDIDVFVFPTRFSSEADPNVVWESLAAGVPLITFPRGCIAEQVGDAAVIVTLGDDFVARALETLQAWISSTDHYRRYAQNTGARYRAMKQQAAQQWQGLLRALRDGGR